MARRLTTFFSLLFFLVATTSSQPADKCSAEDQSCHANTASCEAKNLHPLFCAPDGARTIALVGNPGTGKSTILNGLAGRPVFSSGLSFGAGLTRRLQEEIIEKVSLFDTPGLNDVLSRKQAGQELDKLIKRNAGLKLGFVVTLQNGRIRPEDITTIRVVLDAIETDTNDKFGVIINQLSSLVMEKFKDPDIKRRIQNYITGSRWTTHWCYVENTESLKGKSDGILSTKELAKFFAELPVARKAGDKVHQVDTDTYEEKLEQEKKRYERKLAFLRGTLAVVTLLSGTSMMLQKVTFVSTVMKNVGSFSGAAPMSLGAMKILKEFLKNGNFL